MKIFVKRIDGLTLPFQAVKKDGQGNVVKTNAAAYDTKTTTDPIITGQKYIPIGYENQEVGNQWLSIDYIEYGTGLKVQPSTLSHHLLLHPRSSNSKYNLVMGNSIGLIDNDYRGEICVRFKYVWQPEDLAVIDGRIVGRVNFDKIYKKGDVVCQILCENTTHVEWEFVDELNQTLRGEGGWGHTTIQEIPTKTAGMPLSEMYNKYGGVATKEKYTEEIKKREQI